MFITSTRSAHTTVQEYGPEDLWLAELQRTREAEARAEADRARAYNDRRLADLRAATCELAGRQNLCEEDRWTLDQLHQAEARVQADHRERDQRRRDAFEADKAALLKAAEQTLAAAHDGYFVGLACPYSVVGHPRHSRRPELIAAGAFRSLLTDQAPLRLNHGGADVAPAYCTRLSHDSSGLHIEAKPIRGSAAAKHLESLVRRDAVRGLSVAWRPSDVTSHVETIDGCAVDVIDGVRRLLEISILTDEHVPAYRGTWASWRYGA